MKECLRSIHRCSLMALVGWIGSIYSHAAGQDVFVPYSQMTKVTQDNHTTLRVIPVVQSTPQGDLASPQLIAWLTALIRDSLPPAYEDNRKWDQQREAWDGLEWRREGMKLETKRRTKMVNAGTWTKYRVEFVEPDKNLHIEFQRLETLPDGKIAFSITVEGLLDVFGRLSQWVRDVQAYSISMNADAVGKLSISGTVDIKLNPLTVPPEVMIRPRIEAARVDLSYFRVRRVSQVGGDFAKLLGEGARKVIDEKIEDTNEKLVDKLNRAIEKKQDKMVFSMQDWLKSKLPSPP